jgi:hypothetical protein
MNLKHKCTATAAAILAATASAVALATPAQALPNTNCAVLAIQENAAWSQYLFWDGLADTASGLAALGDELNAERYFDDYARIVRMEGAFHC